MQPLAAWLVARPQNAILALAATLLVPVLQVFSGIIMVLLVLRQGVRLAVVEAAIAGAILAVASFVAKYPLQQVVISVLMIWVPAMLMGQLLRSSRSLTLTLQAMGLVLTGIAIVVFGVVNDVVEFAEPLTTFWLELYRGSGLQEEADRLAADREGLALSLLVTLLWGCWVLYVLYLLVGYRMARSVGEDKPDFGVFWDLNFGKVLAVGMAVLSITGFATGLPWLQKVAVVMMALFWLQGLALVHWMRGAGVIAPFALILTYMLLFLPVLNKLLIIGLAVVGFTDVWFGFRPRIIAKLKNRNW